MRRYFSWAIASIISLGFGGLALAADMPVKAPVYKAAPAPVYSWTGWYVGLNAGAAIDDSSNEMDPSGCFLLAVGNCGVGGAAANPLRTFYGPNHQTAFTGGAQAGYNWQVQSWVFGFETDINYSGINESSTQIPALTGVLTRAFPVVSFGERLDWFGTLRGRIGFTPTSNWLLYATGGLAYGQVSSSTNVLFPLSCCGGDNYVGSMSTTRVGWTAGAGAEWAFSGNWSVKAEYLYVDLGSTNYLDPIINAAAVGVPATASYTTNLSAREHIVRVGVNYHFNGPVVAKY